MLLIHCGNDLGDEMLSGSEPIVAIIVCPGSVVDNLTVNSAMWRQCKDTLLVLLMIIITISDNT